MKEVVQNGVNGLLVSPGNPGELAAAIVKIMHDPDFAKRLAANARKTIEENFSIKKSSQSLFSLYLDIARRQQE
jgi:glycosyltransferase involved in cell wall biosynthesis